MRRCRLTILAPTGIAYYFTRQRKTSDDCDIYTLGWFGKALSRFKNSVRLLVGVSAFTNILAVLFPLIFMFIYDRVIGGRSTETLPYILLGVMIILSADLSLRLIRSRIIGFVAGRLDYLLGTAAFEKILELPPSYTERAAVSAQMSRIKEFESLRDFFTGPLALTVLDLPFTLLMIVVVALISKWLALVPVLTLIGFVFLGAFTLSKAKEYARISGRECLARDDLLVESLLQMRTIKEMGAEDLWLNRYRLKSASAAKNRYISEVYTAISDSLGYALIVISGIITLIIGTLGVMDGTLSIGALIATMILSWRILSPIQVGFLTYSKLDQIKRSLAQLNNLMKLKGEGTEGRSSLLRESYDGDIVFNRVSFRYSTASDPALLGASFQSARRTIGDSDRTQQRR